MAWRRAPSVAPVAGALKVSGPARQSRIVTVVSDLVPMRGGGAAQGDHDGLVALGERVVRG